MTTIAPRVIVCADWSKRPDRRRVWLADPEARVLRRLAGQNWTVSGLTEEASRWTGFSLISFDAPVGVPSSYFAAAKRAMGADAARTFMDWLPDALDQPQFFEPVTDASRWMPQQPFFSVPGGTGSLKAFQASAEQYGVVLRRRVEEQTQGNSVFAMNLPGQVAPAAQALWSELVDARRRDLPIAVWPFDGDLGQLASRGMVVAAEIYPRAAYGTALAASLPTTSRSIAKTRGHVRVEVIHAFEKSEWLRRHEIELEGRDYALADDGDFDALLTAAALLRLTLEGRPLHECDPDPVAEGGMLCA